MFAFRACGWRGRVDAMAQQSVQKPYFFMVSWKVHIRSCARRSRNTQNHAKTMHGARKRAKTTESDLENINFSIS